MVHFRIGFYATTMFASTAAFAQNDSVKIGPIPDWVEQSELLAVPGDASGMVFVRRQDTVVHLDDDGQATFTGQVFKLLHPQALQLGNVSIAWNPASGAPTVHKVEIHRDGQAVDVLEKTEFEILRREDQLEQAMLDGTLTAILRVPDLRVGDELHFAATVPSEDPTLRATSYGLLFIAPTPPPGRIRLGLTWTDGQEPTIAIPEEFAGMATRTDNRVDIVTDDLGAANIPTDAPPRYGWGRIMQYSDFSSWQHVSSRVAEMFDGPSKLEPGSPLRAEIDRIASATTDPMERAEMALAMVQDQVRYIYVGLNGGNFTPASADTTWERRYGDCKGKTTLLLALLEGLGIEAEAVLANNGGADDALDARLPNPAMFDHVLVRATIDGKQWWLDGTFPSGYGPLERPLLPYRWVLPLSEQGAELERQPAIPPRLPLEMSLFEIDAREGFDTAAKLTVTRVTRGLDGLVQEMQLSAFSSDQLEARMKSALASDTSWDAVESVDYRFDKATQASILTIRGLSKPDWEKSSAGAYSLSLPGGGFSPPARRQRPREQDQSAPYYSAPAYSCDVTTVMLPRDTPLENWGFNSTFDTVMFGRLYYRMMEKTEDGTIRMVRGSRVERTEVSAEKAELDNDRIDTFDNSKANIYFDPRNTMDSWGDLRPVPEASDAVWLGDDPPCLPPEIER